jgi:hypothetical protein
VTDDPLAAPPIKQESKKNPHKRSLMAGRVIAAVLSSGAQQHLIPY